MAKKKNRRTRARPAPREPPVSDVAHGDSHGPLPDRLTGPPAIEEGEVAQAHHEGDTDSLPDLRIGRRGTGHAARHRIAGDEADDDHVGDGEDHQIDEEGHGPLPPLGHGTAERIEGTRGRGRPVPVCVRERRRGRSDGHRRRVRRRRVRRRRVRRRRVRRRWIVRGGTRGWRVRRLCLRGRTRRRRVGRRGRATTTVLTGCVVGHGHAFGQNGRPRRIARQAGQSSHGDRSR